MSFSSGLVLRQVSHDGQEPFMSMTNLQPIFQLLVAERQHLKPVSDLPEPGKEYKAGLDQPDGRLEGTNHRKRSSEQSHSKVPFLMFHHAKVLVEGKLAHGVEGEPVHDFVDHNLLLGCRYIGDVIHKNSNLSVDAVLVQGDGFHAERTAPKVASSIVNPLLSSEHQRKVR